MGVCVYKVFRMAGVAWACCAEQYVQVVCAGRSVCLEFNERLSGF